MKTYSNKLHKQILKHPINICLIIIFLKLQTQTHFETLLENQRRINEYDRKKMMEDFALEARHKKLLKNVQDKYKTISAHHFEKVHEIKTKNENMHKQRDKEFRRKMEKKQESIRKHIEMKKNMFLEGKKKREQSKKAKEEDNMKILQEYKNSEEVKRLIIEKETFEKCKYI